jgi:S1-C subfamily serine protease
MTEPAASPTAVRALDAAEAEARLGELSAILVDAVAHGASVNFLAGFTHAEGQAFWRGQLPGITAGSTRLLVADDGARLVGTVLVFLAHQPNAPHRAEIGKMLVLSAARRQGIGRRLLVAAESAARAAGRTLLMLDTETGSAGDLLYRSLGWVEVGRVPDHAYRADGRLAETTVFYKALGAHRRPPARRGRPRRLTRAGPLRSSDGAGRGWRPPLSHTGVVEDAMDTQDMDALARLSEATSARVAGAAGLVVAVRPVGGRARSGVLWRDGVAVASEQALPDAEAYEAVLPGGQVVAARLAGRDPGTNVAAFRLDGASAAVPLPAAAEPRAGALALALGTDGAGGVTARFAMVQEAGPAWQSQAGGRVDRRIVLDARLGGADEGGPVLDGGGGLLGMSTLGPRRRALVIPAATVERVVGPLLERGSVARGWLGVALQPVAVPQALREAAGAEAGLMVLSLAEGGPAAVAGVLPGDILVALDGHGAARPRALAERLGPDSVGRTLELRLLRAGQALTLPVTVTARPER